MLEFEEFVTLASRFMVEEDAEAMQQELKEAFRLYDKEGWLFFILIFPKFSALSFIHIHISHKASNAKWVVYCSQFVLYFPLLVPTLYIVCMKHKFSVKI